MSLVPSLLQAILKVDGEALVMHAGEKPYVVAPAGQIELASRGLTLEAVDGIVGQLLPPELLRALDEFGAVQYELPAAPEFPREHFTVVAARGGDDLWTEIRRRRVPDDDHVPEDLFPPRGTPPAPPADVAMPPVAVQPVVAPPVAAPVVAAPAIAAPPVAAPPLVAPPVVSPPIAATLATEAIPAQISIAQQPVLAAEAAVAYEEVNHHEPYVRDESIEQYAAAGHHQPLEHRGAVEHHEAARHDSVVAHQETTAYGERVIEEEEFEEEFEEEIEATEEALEEDELDDGLTLPDADQLFGKRRQAESDHDEFGDSQEFEEVEEYEEYEEYEEGEEFEEGDEFQIDLDAPEPSPPQEAPHVQPSAVPTSTSPVQTPPSAHLFAAAPFETVPQEPPVRVAAAPPQIAEMPPSLAVPPPPIIEAPRPVAEVPSLVAASSSPAVVHAPPAAAHVTTHLVAAPPPEVAEVPPPEIAEVPPPVAEVPPPPIADAPSAVAEVPPPVAVPPAPSVVEAPAVVAHVPTHVVAPPPEVVEDLPPEVAEIPPPQVVEIPPPVAAAPPPPIVEAPSAVAEVPPPVEEPAPATIEPPHPAAEQLPLVAILTPPPVSTTPLPVWQAPTPVMSAPPVVVTEAAPPVIESAPPSVVEAPHAVSEVPLPVAETSPVAEMPLVAEVPLQAAAAMPPAAEMPPVAEVPPIAATLPPPPVVEPPAPVAEPSAPRPTWAARVPPPATVLSMSRNPIRSTEFLPPPVLDPTMSGLDRLLRVSAARGASTLYLSTDAQPSVRVDGELHTIDGEPVLSARDVESLLLTLMPERSHEALRTGAATEWFCDIDVVGRVRCLSFRDHRGPGGVFRLMPTRSVSVDQLGLPRSVQALAIEPEGLVLVAGPRSSGKRTLLSAFVDQINKTRRDHVITIEREVNIVHESGSSFVSQREVRGNDDDMLVAARAALREDPDVLVIEDLRTAPLMNVALEAASAGRLVVGGFSAHTAAGAIDRIIDLYAPEYRGQVQMALADCLRGVIVQVLLRKAAGGRVPAREVLLNTPSVSSVIAEGKTSQLAMAIEGGRRYGMMPINDGLVGLVEAGVVDAREAYRRSTDRPGFLAALKRQGIDTSFVERLA